MAKKGGKYSHVIGQLPKFPGENPDRRNIVETVRQSILSPDEDVEILEAEKHRLVVDALVDSIDKTVKALIKLERGAVATKPWASEFARIYAELRMVRNRIENWDSSFSVLLEAYEGLMIAQFEVEGVSSLKLLNGQPVSTFEEPYAQVTDKEAFRIWCVDQGLERQMTLPWQTVNKLAKDRLLEGEEEPPGVTLYAKTKIRLGSE